MTKSGVQEGLCLVNAMHITASVFINDNEGGVIQDLTISRGSRAPRADKPLSSQPHRRGQRRRA